MKLTDVIYGFHPVIRLMTARVSEEELYTEQLAKMSDDAVRGHLNPDVQRVLFLLYHAAVTEDTLLYLITRNARVFDVGSWEFRLCLPRPYRSGVVLTGISDTEALRIGASLSFSQLENYRSAVFQKGLWIAQNFSEEVLDERVDTQWEEEVAARFHSDAVRDSVLAFWRGKNGLFLLFHGLVHQQQHFGEVISLLGRAGLAPRI